MHKGFHTLEGTADCHHIGFGDKLFRDYPVSAVTKRNFVGTVELVIRKFGERFVTTFVIVQLARVGFDELLQILGIYVLDNAEVILATDLAESITVKRIGQAHRFRNDNSVTNHRLQMLLESTVHVRSQFKVEVSESLTTEESVLGGLESNRADGASGLNGVCRSYPTITSVKTISEKLGKRNKETVYRERIVIKVVDMNITLLVCARNFRLDPVSTGPPVRARP